MSNRWITDSGNVEAIVAQQRIFESLAVDLTGLMKIIRGLGFDWQPFYICVYCSELVFLKITHLYH